MHAPGPRPQKRLLRLKLNGRWREDAVAERELLVDYLRDVARLTGVKTGCDGGECGDVDPAQIERQPDHRQHQEHGRRHGD